MAPRLTLALILTVACTGRTGPPGADGMNGVDGAMGAMGVMGAMGLPGATGAMGTQGDKGETGAQGEPGRDGTDGTDGVDGKDGTNGKDGVDGRNGVDGKDGTNGKDGVSAAQALQAVLDKVVPKKSAILNVVCWQPCPPDVDDGDCSGGLLWVRGTGAKLAGGEVLTADHVTEDATGCALQAEDGNVVGQSSTFHTPVAGRDLVHIRDITWTAAGQALPGYEVKKGHTPQLGELILVASFPGAVTRSLQLTFGYVTSTNTTASFPPAYRTYWSAAWSSDNASTNGSSGGPVFDSNGDLIAILVGRPNDDSLDLRFSLPLLW